MPPLAACDRDFLLALGSPIAAIRTFIAIEGASGQGGGRVSG